MNNLQMIQEAAIGQPHMNEDNPNADIVSFDFGGGIQGVLMFPDYMGDSYYFSFGIFNDAFAHSRLDVVLDWACDAAKRRLVNVFH